MSDKIKDIIELFSPALLEGGAITSFQSIVYFNGETNLSNNRARNGGALYITESQMFINGNVTIANNTVPNMESSASGYGGGIYLYQSDFTVNSGNCTIAKNQAMKGGGIYASSSVISVRQYASLKFLDNTAHTVGGGIYAEASARLNLLEL